MFGVVQVAVIGAGRMGIRIAKLFSEEYDVLLFDSNITNIDTTIIQDSDVKIVTDLNDVKNAAIVIECINENIQDKLSLYSVLEDLISKNTIIATNTSSLSINEMAASLLFKERFIGMHFMNPPDKNLLVEIIKSNYTNENVYRFITDMCNKLNKICINVKDSPCFIVNKLLIPMINEAAKLLDNKIATKEDIDKAMEIGAAHPIGPLALADMIGIDIIVNILDNLNKASDLKIYHPSRLLLEMVKSNHLGKKTKKGFYSY